MYSQNDEESAILRYFGIKPGRLLDIGAYNGIDLSNSRQLIINGWSAVLVEPDPRNMVELTKLYGTNENVSLIQSAVSGVNDLLRISCEESRLWASTIVGSCVKAHSIEVSRKFFIPTITMVDLEVFGEFDFISIDAEWNDWDILTSTPDRMLKSCSMVCVEPCADHPRVEMSNYLKSKGFKLYHETTENLIMSK